MTGDIKKKTASDGACGLSGDPSAVTKIFIVSCATDSYEMCFCGTYHKLWYTLTFRGQNVVQKQPLLTAL